MGRTHEREKMALQLRHFSRTLRILGVRSMSQTGDWGSGAGKGGGGGGSVREAGGSFGKMEAAHEEQYFRKLQSEQLKGLRHMMEDEVKYHDQQIKLHQEAIERHKKKIGNPKHEEKKTKDGYDSE